MLFPQLNSHRAVHDLSGFWRFLADPDDRGEQEEWFLHPLSGEVLTIAVPGAWNEQLAERGLMNFVGRGWYETEFTLPPIDRHTQRVLLRIGGAEHRARAWLNGKPVGCHEGGYLPFELDLSGVVSNGSAPNRLTVSVDSRLTMETLPQGMDPGADPYNRPGTERRHVFPPARFDFFPYGGLTRPVRVLIVPALRLDSISVRAALSGNVEVAAEIAGEGGKAFLRILDSRKNIVGETKCEVSGGVARAAMEVANPQLWSPSVPALYSAEMHLLDAAGRECDRYTETFGFREIRIDGGQILLNGTPLYLAGFGKHEDVPIVGRGQFRPAILRDFELMRWVGANSFRTSHYPYDEEVMQLADRFGFLVLDEVPAVSLGFQSDRFEELQPLLRNHENALTKLIERDRNHPSVIAWSIGNEPNLWNEPHYQTDASRQYFRRLYNHVRGLDPYRPVIAIAASAFSADDVMLEACDIIGINRYFGWYTDPGELEKARRQLDSEMTKIFARHNKPIVITECGVDTVEGFHATTARMFTEEYQTEFLKAYSAVAESKPYCAGMHVWNFADFLTPQNHRRVMLNRKGVFTRTREPKGAAFFLREHWAALGRLADEHRPQRHNDSTLVPDITQAR